MQSDLQVMPEPEKHLGGPCFAHFLRSWKRDGPRKRARRPGSDIAAAD
jgi:hypothetical protein